MSVNTSNEQADPGRFTPLEARLYALLPLDYRITTLLVFVLCFGSLILITWISQAPPPLMIEAGEDGAVRYEIHGAVWASFVLSLIMTAALGLSEGTRRLSRSEEVALAASLKPDTPAETARLRGAPDSWKPWYRGALIAGLIGGLLFNAFMVFGPASMPLDRYLGSIGLWFVLFSSPLYALGFRAGVNLAREASELSRIVRDHLDVDLFHLERLQVYGRIGLRGAFSWMVMAAIIMLFLASPSAERSTLRWRRSRSASRRLAARSSSPVPSIRSAGGSRTPKPPSSTPSGTAFATSGTGRWRVKKAPLRRSPV